MGKEEKLIRLLIVEEDSHRAEQIISSLRATGMQVRAEFAEDDEDMDELLESKSFDVVLFSLNLPEFSLSQGRQLIEDRGRHIALVALARQADPAVVTEAIANGARDAATTANIEHLIQVINREAEFVALWRHAQSLEVNIQESERRCQNLLATSIDAVSYVHEGIHIFANQTYLDLLGIGDFDDLEGVSLIDMVDASQKDELKAFLRELHGNRNETRELELQLVHGNGDIFSATLEFAPASYDGEPCTQILIRADPGTSQLEEQINYLHQHDLVSGLYNRQYFMDELKSALTQAVNGSGQFALVYIAIDNFQSVRDAVGISGCDVLIADIAKIISTSVDQEFTVARFGAYSYVCIGKFEEKARVEAFATKIPQLVEQHISEIGEQTITATCSVAVVFIDENSPNNPNAIVSRAEKTCDEVQTLGGNKSQTYVLKAGEMTRDEEDGITAGLIKEALNQNRIRGLYQPIVGVKGQAGERYQSSIEIATADGRLLDANEYKSAAERTGTAKMLDRWKILHAIKKVSETARQGRAIEFFIPLSADSVQDAGLALWVSENITKAKINGHQLVFMLNEAQVLSQLKAAKNLTRALKQFRCQFAIDEFGTGLNPFQLVKHIDADYVRVNHSFMEDLIQNSVQQESIRELTARARDMELKTITPGVADASALSVIWTLDVDFIQGNFLQPPQQDLNYDFTSM
jgi:multidomain signaling protein FimX